METKHINFAQPSGDASNRARRANNKTSGGSKMSTKTAAHRVALFSGSSLGLAAFASAVSIGVAAMPSAAAAQATCVSGTTITNNGTNSVAIAGGNPNNPGITCTYVGDTAVVTLGTPATTVSTVAPGGGINLSAAGDDSINWVSTAATLTGGAQTQGAVIDARTATGNINISTAAVAGTNATITYGIYAESTGAGDINILANGGTVSGTNATSGIAGIYAASNGGDITVHQNFTTSQATATGRLYGIRAATIGAGNLTLSATPGGSGGANMTTTGNTGIAAIDASVGTGDLLIQVVGGVNNSNPTGIGIRATTRGGDALIQVIQGSVQAGASNTPGSTSAAIALDMVGGATVIDNLGTGRVGVTSSNRRGDTLLTAVGSGSITLNNSNLIYGAFQLGGHTGPFTLNNSGADRGWSTGGQSVFSTGVDTINNLAGGMIVLGTPGSSGMSLQTTSLNFGAGEDVFNNAGMIVVGENHSTNFFSTVGKTFQITNLEQFNNSGIIVMGSYEASIDGVLGQQTDLHYDDVFILRDSHFHGEEGSRIWLDSNFNNTGQISCARNVDGLPQGVPLTDPKDGRLRANDCLDFRGSAISGRTGLIIADVIAGDRGAYNPEGNVVVEVIGSDPADVDPEAFFIAPESAGYNAAGIGFIDKGMFAYTVGYDPESETFRIYGVESPSAAQLLLFGQAANDLWRTATTPWLERRVVQRGAEEVGDLTPRFWLRGSYTTADRAVHDSASAGLAVLDYDNSYTQEDASLTMGMDLGRGTAFGGEWVVGAMAGYAQARLAYEASINTATFEGGTVGLYSGFTAGPFFHDMVINAALTNLLVDVPSLQLTPTGTLLETDVMTLGGHTEMGWRLAFGSMRVEPLATLSWSQASFDVIDVPAEDPVRFGGDIEFDDANSMRAGLGLRFSIRDVVPSLFPVDVNMTGRSVRELDGESAVTIVNLGPDANLSRAFDGQYSELNAGLSIGEAAEHFGAFLNVGGAWGDDYDAKSGSLGMRLRW